MKRPVNATEAEGHIARWMEGHARITASLFFGGSIGAGAYLTGVIVEANGFRAVEGDTGGFVMIPPLSDADSITCDKGGGDMIMRLEFGEMSLILTHDAGLRTDA